MRLAYELPLRGRPAERHLGMSGLGGFATVFFRARVGRSRHCRRARSRPFAEPGNVRSLSVMKQRWTIRLKATAPAIPLCRMVWHCFETSVWLRTFSGLRTANVIRSRRTLRQGTAHDRDQPPRSSVCGNLHPCLAHRWRRYDCSPIRSARRSGVAILVPREAALALQASLAGVLAQPHVRAHDRD